MKSIRLLLLALFATTVVFGQEISFPMEAGQKDQSSELGKTHKTLVSPKFKARFDSENSQLMKKDVESFWTSYLISKQNLLGSSPRRLVSSLFADSTIHIPSVDENLDTTYFDPFTHNILNIFDPTTLIFEQDQAVQLTQYTEYQVDSISIGISYPRYSDPSVVDTMIVWLFADDPGTNIDIYYFSGQGMQQNYGSDTVRFASVDYNHQTNSPGVANARMMKIPLRAGDGTGEDSSGFVFLGRKDFAVEGGPLQVGANQLFGMAMTYKPGYDYTPGDTLGPRYGRNVFRFISYEENGTSTYPTYLEGDYNGSGIIPTRVRYNRADSWNGVYMPTYAFVQEYGTEHHDIQYHITALNVGMKDDPFSGYKLGRAYPNPARVAQEVNIDFTIANRENVEIELHNLLGQKVMTVTSDDFNAGTHTISFDTQNLKPGMYFYTMKAGGFTKAYKLHLSK